MSSRRVRIQPDEIPDATVEGRPLTLPDDAAHYVGDVLRMEPGDALEIFDGDGRLLDCRVQRVSADDVRVMVLEDRRTRRNESDVDLTLCQAIPKGKRWKWIMEKTTELGVDRIVPIETNHGVVQIPDEKRDRKLERWRRVVGSAARQCERTMTPTLTPPRAIDALVPSDEPTLDLVVHARRDSVSLADAVAGHDSDDRLVRVWVGPEGGFSDDETELLCEHGGRLCHLGPRILRSETAAVVATAIVQDVIGDLRLRNDND